MSPKNMTNNELMKKMFENKDFMSNILKMKNRNEVKKAFENKGLEVTKNDVDALGKTLAKASGLADKCSKEELNVLAELFENLDSNSLAKVAGGGWSWTNNLVDFLGYNPEKKLELFIKLKEAGFITPEGQITQAGEEIIKGLQHADNLKNELVQLAKKYNTGGSTPNKQKQMGSIGGNPASAAPAATSSSSSNNTAMYATAGVGAVAVSLLGLAYAFRGKIKSWFN